MLKLSFPRQNKTKKSKLFQAQISDISSQPLKSDHCAADVKVFLGPQIFISKVSRKKGAKKETKDHSGRLFLSLVRGVRYTNGR